MEKLQIEIEKDNSLPDFEEEVVRGRGYSSLRKLSKRADRMVR